MQTLLLLALACYRATRLITIDDGPLDMFRRLRIWAGAYSYGADGRPATNLGRLLLCPYCTGIFVALFLWALQNSPLPAPLKRGVVEVLGVAGAQAFIQGIVKE